MGKQDLIRFREPLGEQELHTSLRAYPCHPWEFRIILARCVLISHSLERSASPYVYVVVKNIP